MFNAMKREEKRLWMAWLIWIIGATIVSMIVLSAVAAVWTGEWRWLIITVFLVWLCNKSTGAQL